MARRTHAEKVRCTKSATAHSAHTHTAEIVAFMYFSCMLQAYRLCAVFDVLECTPPQAPKEPIPRSSERYAMRDSGTLRVSVHSDMQTEYMQAMLTGVWMLFIGALAYRTHPLVNELRLSLFDGHA